MSLNLSLHALSCRCNSWAATFRTSELRSLLPSRKRARSRLEAPRPGRSRQPSASRTPSRTLQRPCCPSCDPLRIYGFWGDMPSGGTPQLCCCSRVHQLICGNAKGWSACVCKAGALCVVRQRDASYDTPMDSMLECPLISL